MLLTVGSKIVQFTADLQPLIVVDIVPLAVGCDPRDLTFAVAAPAQAAAGHGADRASDGAIQRNRIVVARQSW